MDQLALNDIHIRKIQENIQGYKEKNHRKENLGRIVISSMFESRKSEVIQGNKKGTGQAFHVTKSKTNSSTNCNRITTNFVTEFQILNCHLHVYNKILTVIWGRNH